MRPRACLIEIYGEWLLRGVQPDKKKKGEIMKNSVSVFWNKKYPVRVDMNDDTPNYTITVCGVKDDGSLVDLMPFDADQSNQARIYFKALQSEYMQ